MGCAEQNLASNIIVLKAAEVEEIMAGSEEKYKALTIAEPNFKERKLEIATNNFKN
jgi:hypothetical protein